MKKSVLLIIPAYNEESNILNTYKKIQEFNKNAKENQYSVIVINDGSRDNTERILRDNKIPYISLINNLGIGGAVQTGYKYAYENNYDIAVQFDGDGQHDVNYVMELIKPILDGEANMTIGSRFVDKNSSEFKSTFARRIGISLISTAIKIKTGIRVKDTTSGFRAADKKTIKMFAKSYPLEYPEPISTTKILLSKLKIAEVPVSMNERIGGKSSIVSWKKAYYMINVMLTILLMKRR